jgi:cytochrome P450
MTINSPARPLGTVTSSEARRCPVEFFKRLVKEAPVYKDPVTGAYIVTRFADIVHVNEKSAIFLSLNERLIGRSGSPVAAEVQRRFREKGFPENHTLITADPPHHRRYPQLVEKIFSPSFVKAFEPRIRAIANQLPAK